MENGHLIHVETSSAPSLVILASIARGDRKLTNRPNRAKGRDALTMDRCPIEAPRIGRQAGNCCRAHATAGIGHDTGSRAFGMDP